MSDKPTMTKKKNSSTIGRITRQRN